MNIKNDNYLLSTGQPGKVKSADLASIANGSPPTRGRPPIAACRGEPRTPNLPLPPSHSATAKTHILPPCQNQTFCAKQ